MKVDATFQEDDLFLRMQYAKIAMKLIENHPTDHGAYRLKHRRLRVRVNKQAELIIRTAVPAERNRSKAVTNQQTYLLDDRL